jgi:hypothetical protein
VSKAARPEARGCEIVCYIARLQEIQHVELLSATVTAVASPEEDRVPAKSSGGTVFGRLGADRPVLTFEERPSDASRRTATRPRDVEQEHPARPKRDAHPAK